MLPGIDVNYLNAWMFYINVILMCVQLFVISISLIHQRKKSYWRDATRIQTIYAWDINGKSLFYDSVHLIKNTRNNLSSCKKCIFPSFTFHGCWDIIDLQSSEISWKIFHNVFKRDETLDLNLKKARKVIMKVNFAKLFFWKPFLEYFW